MMLNIIFCSNVRRNVLNCHSQCAFVELFYLYLDLAVENTAQ
jgi:hypothetical protein